VSAPVLHGTQVTLRPVGPDDVERLAEILAEPEVSRWWPYYDAERVRRDLLEAQDTTVFVIDADDAEVVGSIQYVEEPAPDYRHATIDVFLHPDWHGKGLGTDSVRTLARYLVHDRGHHRLAIDPAADNEKAIRTYKRVGFREVGVMREYERNSQGEWQDCVLMDLLKRDLS
jgi:aminoglycoside 6'-N-acetyltransferase